MMTGKRTTYSLVVVALIAALVGPITPSALGQTKSNLHLYLTKYGLTTDQAKREGTPSLISNLADRIRRLSKRFGLPMPAPESGHTPRYFAGSMMVLNIEAKRRVDGLRVSLAAANAGKWPEGLTVFAGTLDAHDHFVPSESLTDQLHVERCPSRFDEYCEIVFFVPCKISVKSFRLNATYENPELGKGEAASYPVIEVVQPKSRADWNVVWDSIVRYLEKTRDAARVVYVADSLISLGYDAPQGLITAQDCAERVQQWDRALKFFERNYQLNGRRALVFGTANMSKEEQSAEYARVRHRLLEGQHETRIMPFKEIL